MQILLLVLSWPGPQVAGNETQAGPTRTSSESITALHQASPSLASKWNNSLVKRLKISISARLKLVVDILMVKSRSFWPGGKIWTQLLILAKLRHPSAPLFTLSRCPMWKRGELGTFRIKADLLSSTAWAVFWGLYRIIWTLETTGNTLSFI